MTTAVLDPSLLGERVGLEAIPVIDMLPFFRGEEDSRQAVAREIGVACRNIGFFYIRNHGIPQTLIDRAFALCAEFFALPVEEKAEIAIGRSPNHRGWFAVGGENLDPSKQKRGGDLKEGIKIGQDLPADHDLVRRGIRLHGPNQWPSRPAEFVPTMRELYYLLSNLSRELMHAFALALQLREDYFDDRLHIPMATLGPLHYPPQAGTITETQIGAGAHSDFGALTILAQDSNGGLQVRNVAGKWINATPIPGTYVVNIGEMMARWTNDVFAATAHRVINASGRERYSMPFFFDPSFDAEVSVLPTCQGPDNLPKYAPTTSYEHLIEMINATFDYRSEAEKM
jgi:isopenicillin N synthase-like dioxygenase